jgi:hypothetical protein
MEELFSGLVIILFLAVATGSRCTEADKIECDTNEIAIGNGCSCAEGYKRSYTGNCDECDTGYLQSTSSDGTLICTKADGDPRNLTSNFLKTDQNVQSQMSSTYDLNAYNEIYRGQPVFDTGNTVRSADQFKNEGENVPGFYPPNNYKQVPFSTLEEVKNGSLKASTKKDFFPYKNSNRSVVATQLKRSVFDNGALDLPYHFNTNYKLKEIKNNFNALETNKLNSGVYPTTTELNYAPKERVFSNTISNSNYDVDRTVERSAPEPENLFKNNGVQNVSSDYALSGMGLNFHNPQQQMTSYANGDVMTGYKPINELMRPISIPILTNRTAEREESYTPNINDGVMAPPIPIEEVTNKRKQGENLGRIPFGNTGSSIPEKPRSKLPERNVGDSLNVWNAANPFYDITGEYNSRRETIFRNKPQIHIPNTMGHGYYGEVLNPLKNTSNSDKFFFAGDEPGMRNITSRDDRHNERILQEPRSAIAHLETNIRSVPNITTTKNSLETNDERQYANMPKEQPIRDSRITTNSLRYDVLSYNQPHMGVPKYEPRDTTMMGLPHF